MLSTLSRYLRPNFIFVVLATLAVFIVAIALGANVFDWQWTGFIAQTPLTDTSNVIYQQQLTPGKTLWDWLELFIVPGSLVLVGYWLNHQQNQRNERMAQHRARIEREVAADLAQETAMQNYFDGIAEMLLDDKFQADHTDDKIKDLAHVRTLTVLLRLKDKRKGLVLRFLQELDLIKGDSPVIGLEGANLKRADLGDNNLAEANFEGVNLCRTRLQGATIKKVIMPHAFLQEAQMAGADLREAFLHSAKLPGAILVKAKLVGTNLQDADLTGADLGSADLCGADLSGAILDNTILQDATYDADTCWPEGFLPPPDAVRVMKKPHQRFRR